MAKSSDSDFNQPDLSQWATGRLSALAPEAEFRPDTIRALGSLRRLREKSASESRTLGWSATAAAAAFLCLLALPAPRATLRRLLNAGWSDLPQVAASSDHPEYAGAKLLRPADYREWVYLSSGLGMEYNASAGGSENFTNVFVPQWAYHAFLASGKWPDKSMFVLESRASETKGSINKSGHFQSDLSGLAVEVKDQGRFADQWAYFNFRGSSETADAMTGPSDACWHCHDANAAVEHTFVQFYPTLKPVALKYGTYRTQAD